MRRSRAIRWLVVTAGAALAAAGCAITTSSPMTASLSGPTGIPIRVGVSLPLSGDFAADGQASLRGYQLWASDVNGNGGLLGRPVKLVYRNDHSDPGATASDYTKLITDDRVQLTLAPFSSLLTAAAVPVVARHGYALAAGSASAPSVYKLKSRNLFSTNVPDANELVPFADWVSKLPAGARPTSAAYPMVSDPFADPPVQSTQATLQSAGIRTVYSQVYKPSTTPAQLTRAAAAVAATKAQMVVLGSVDVPTVSAFINEFAKVNYNPKIFIAAAGPDQGTAFLNAVGPQTATGVMFPDAWYGSFPDALSHLMVQNYIARYGGTAADINADVAEAYSAGEVLAAAVTGTGSLSQARIMSWLHRSELNTVVGLAKFGSNGQNTAALQTGSALIFQWQQGGRFSQVLPSTAEGSVTPVVPKPGWNG
jgi:branched-chain amino acid transport system substrate-binding protein